MLRDPREKLASAEQHFNYDSARSAAPFVYGYCVHLIHRQHGNDGTCKSQLSPAKPASDGVRPSTALMLASLI